MTPDTAQVLGNMIRNRRKALELSAAALAMRVGVRPSTIARLEHGRFAAPRPDKLARIAEALGLTMADVFALVGYVVPSELPGFESYVSVKYPELSKTARTELVGRFKALLAISRDITGWEDGKA